MIIGITGHTRGIGKSLFDLYSEKGRTIGFSRSNGYDIANEHHRLKILKICSAFDVFINNAWDITGQADLLIKFISEWHGNKDKTIINICSKSVYLEEHVLHPYAASKKELDQIIKSRKFEPYPRILNIVPGIVDTDLAKDLQVTHKLSPYDTAKFIIEIADLVSPICVQEVVFSDPREYVPLPEIEKHDQN